MMCLGIVFYDRTVASVVTRQANCIETYGPLNSKLFVLNSNRPPFSVIQIFQRIIRIEPFLKNIGDIRFIPRSRPGNTVIPTHQKDGAAEPTDSRRVEFAGSYQ